MLTYNLELREGKPLYEYLYLCIRNDIKIGKIPPHTKLPSKRALSKQLGISVITVKNAYEQLLSEGYITSVEKCGYFVLDVGGASSLAQKSRENKKRQEIDGEDTVYDLSSNIPNPELFPFSVWSKLMRRVLSEEDAKLLRRVPTAGVYALREAIAEYLFESRGMDVSADNIIIGAGTDYIYNLLLQLLGKGKKYGIENPGYKKIGDILARCGMKYSLLEMDNFGVIPDKINKIDVMHISSSHHYPTGIVMPSWRRREILELAEACGMYIIDDDYDSEFRFSGIPIRSLYSEDRSGRVIYINTFSQTISPSIRISYMVLPDSLLERFNSELSFYSCPVPSFEQYTLASFISEGYYEKHINRMRNYYKAQRKMAIEAVQSISSPCFEIIEEGAGLHFILKISTTLTDREIKDRCKERGLKINFVSDFLYSSALGYEHLAVINYTNTDSEKMKNALTVLSELV